MARLVYPITGTPSGKIGDYIFKVRNNKSYVCRRPLKVKNPCTAGQVKSRDLFSFCSTLSSAITKINAYYSRWKNIYPYSDNVKNNIHKLNYLVIKESENISDIILVPEEDPFTVEVIYVQFLEKKVTVRINPVSIPGILGTRISVQGLMQLERPYDEYLSKNRFIPLYSKDYEYKPDVELNFEILFNSQSIENAKLYADKNLLINFALKNIEGVSERFSETWYQEF